MGLQPAWALLHCLGFSSTRCRVVIPGLDGEVVGLVEAQAQRRKRRSLASVTRPCARPSSDDHLDWSRSFATPAPARTSHPSSSLILFIPVSQAANRPYQPHFPSSQPPPVHRFSSPAPPGPDAAVPAHRAPAQDDGRDRLVRPDPADNPHIIR